MEYLDLMNEIAAGRLAVPPTERPIDEAERARRMIWEKQQQVSMNEIVRARDQGRAKQDAVEKQREKAMAQADKARSDDNREQWTASFVKQWTAAGNDLHDLTPSVLSEAYLAEQKRRVQAGADAVARKYAEWI